MVLHMISYKRLYQLRKARSVPGFAYLWTLMLIAFMGIGLSVGGHMYHTALQRDKEQELLFIGRQFRLAIARFQAAGPDKGQYPASLDDLLKDPRFPNTVRHLRRIYRDPMTGKTEWGTVLVNGKIVGVHSLSEGKPIKQDNFEANESGFRGKEKYSEWAFTWPPDLLLKNQGGEGSKPGAVGQSGSVPATQTPGVQGGQGTGMTGDKSIPMLNPEAADGKK